MRSSIIASTALATALALGAPALAQQQQEQQQGNQVQTETTRDDGTVVTTTTGGQQAATTGAGQAGTPQGAMELIGADVLGQGGDEVGQINNVLVDNQGNPTHVILGHGGWLGLGEKEVALQLDQIQVSGDQIQVNMSDEQLAEMPEYESPGMTEGQQTGQAPADQSPAAGTTERQQAGEAPTGQSQSPGQTPRQSNSVESPPGPSGATLETTPGVMPEPERPQAPND